MGKKRMRSKGEVISKKGGVFPKTITVASHTYKYNNSFYRLSKAKEYAKRLRQQGYRVRLYRSGLLSGIGIYIGQGNKN